MQDRKRDGELVEQEQESRTTDRIADVQRPPVHHTAAEARRARSRAARTQRAGERQWRTHGTWDGGAMSCGPPSFPAT